MVKKLLSIIMILLMPSLSYGLPAFPGAQGWGSTTVGGRSASAKLCKVNTLDGGASSGSSLGNNIYQGNIRFCIDQNNLTGPKLVIFTVGGTIDLGATGLTIRQPFTTIAGQTAPGGGILIRGPAHQGNDCCSSITLATHDVIIRGIRVRDNGKSALTLVGNADAWGAVYNVIIDHNSMSWSIDTVYEAAIDTRNITFSYNIASEGLYNYLPGESSEGMITLGRTNCSRIGTDAYNISIHHNLFAHNGSRNPLIKFDTGVNEIINNVVYNFGYSGINVQTSSYISRNVLIRGLNSTISPRGILVSGAGAECSGYPQNGTVMVSHNIGPDRPTDTGDDWLAVDGGTSSYRTDSPPFTLWGMTEDDVSTIKTKILANAGATVPSRDSVDARIISDVTNNTGSWITNPSQVGGWPTIASGSYSTDTDGDGIPDAWESAHGLNSGVVDSLTDSASGYLWIEEYINSFFAEEQGDTTPPVRYNGTPGSVPSGTTQTTISLTTSEAATCRWSDTPGTTFNNMPNTFSGGGTSSHSFIVGGITYSDDFNRSNENPLSGGGNWIRSGTNTNDLQLSSNAVLGTTNTARNSMYYNATLSPNQCASVAVSDDSIGPAVRIQSGKSYMTGYVLREGHPPEQSGVLVLYRYDDDGNSGMIDSVSGSVSPGDILKICMEGKTITTYKNGSPIAGLGLDDPILISGFPGVYTFVNTISADNFVADGVSQLSDGSSYNYYVRCQDSSNNQNTDDFLISFQVQGGGGGGSPTSIGNFVLQGAINQ